MSQKVIELLRSKLGFTISPHHTGEAGSLTFWSPGEDNNNRDPEGKWDSVGCRPVHKQDVQMWNLLVELHELSQTVPVDVIEGILQRTFEDPELRMSKDLKKAIFNSLRKQMLEADYVDIT